jgi:F-type H+-transporting ATPase subunit a
MKISLAAEPIFHIGNFPITNTLLAAWAIILFLILIVLLTHKRLQEVPRGLQNVVETLVDGALNFMETITGDRGQARKFFPIVFTIFIFVILSNWIGIVPGLGTIGLLKEYEGKTILAPFIRSASTDLNVTLAIATVSVISTQIFGILAIGFGKYGKKFLPFGGLFKIKYGFLPIPSFNGLIAFFAGFLELIAELAKFVSFSFRLFGNIFAGKVLLTVVSFLAPYIVPLPFLFLEIFIGFVQALVFAMLTLVFLKMAVTEPEHEEHATH